MGEDLYHHGVLGQKWGVIRKARSSGGRNRSGAAIKAPMELAPKSFGMTSRKGNVNIDAFQPQKRPTDLSDDEMRRVINRIRMERELTDLLSPKKANNESVKKGNMYVDALKKGSAAAVTTIVSAALISYVRKKAKGSSFEW